MPRQIRLEFKGAIYHVINRGNYRSDVFASDGAKLALLTALGETAQKLNWRVHAWAIMSNHYHVALETPRGNLVEGMNPDYALEILKGGSALAIFSKIASIHGRFLRGKEIFKTREWACETLHAPNAKQ